jgi:hypothetical protein
MKSFLMFCLGCVAFSGFAQTITLKGRVSGNGEPLPLAHVLIVEDSTVRICDSDGNFVYHRKPGLVTLRISYTGYETHQSTLRLRRDTVVTFQLSPTISNLEEVVVTGQRFSQQELFESTRTSSTVVTANDISALPVLGGEADMIKAIQLLPGSIQGIEGSTDLFVRGGAADQNLVLLDQVPVYNTSHLFGFLSVFNPDIIEKVESVNGGFPADYGGRLSSVLDIQTRSAIPDETKMTGNIGTIATRLFAEVPLVDNKIGFWIAGRRTYIDQLMKLAGENLPYYFSDINGKVTFKPASRDEVTFSYNAGDDFLDYFRDRNNDGDGMTMRFASGNDSQSLSWERQLYNGWSTELLAMRTAYRYRVENFFEENALFANSRIEDYGVKAIFTRDSLWGDSRTRFGAEWIRHSVSPVVVNTAGWVAEFLESSQSGARYANHFALHAQHEWSLSERLRINAGLRGSMAVVENTEYSYAEPRLSLRYALDQDANVKLSYSRMVQYMHRVSSSAASTPTDIWYPVTDKISPQTSHQITAAWQKRVVPHHLYISVETYYKRMGNLIGYEEGTNLFFNTDFASRLVQGTGNAYGMELLVKKEAGRLTGWVSYTLSWSTRQFDRINGGNCFYSRYDRRHNGAIVGQYALNNRWALSLVFEYISGARFTPVIGQYVVFAPTLTGLDLIPVYSDINSVRLADTHRLDLGVRYKSRPGKRYQWQIFAGIYNVYNRANPVGIDIVEDETDGSLSYQQPGVFGLIPFLSYGFSF